MSPRSPEEAHHEALRSLALEYIKLARRGEIVGPHREGALYGTNEAFFLHNHLLTLLGRAGDPDFDLLDWAMEITADLRDDFMPKEERWSGPHLVRAGDTVGVMVTHAIDKDLNLVAVLQVGPEEMVVVPIDEPVDATEEEARAAARARLLAAVQYAEVLGIDEDDLSSMFGELLADYEPLRAAMTPCPLPESVR